jgi:hypothetical protein
MRLDLRNKFLSGPRYSRYLAAVENNNMRAKRLYHANMRLTQAFHPVLSQFEVILRNSINSLLTDHFEDPDWIINQKIGFMRDPTLKSSRYFLRTCVQRAEVRLIQKGIPLSGGRIVADQTFGFWHAFFLPHHYALVAGQPIHIFPHKPYTENRASICNKLQRIRHFRNRVSHCEPICFAGQAIDCSAALAVRADLYDLVAWIDPDLIPFFESMDSTLYKADYIVSF